jgi:hypothetical protein
MGAGQVEGKEERRNRVSEIRVGCRAERGRGRNEPEFLGSTSGSYDVDSILMLAKVTLVDW